MINGAAAVGRGSMLADVLDAPVAELTVGDDIDASKDFVDARTLSHVSIGRDSTARCTFLVLFETILEDVLHHQTTSLTKSDLVPHTT